MVNEPRVDRADLSRMDDHRRHFETLFGPLFTTGVT